MRVPFVVRPVLSAVVGVYSAPPPANPNLKPCGDAYYLSSQYTCYNGDFLCPVLNGEATLRCGPACYRPEMYRCVNGELVYPPAGGAAAGSPGSGSATTSSGLPAGSSASSSSPSGTVAAAVCTETPTTQHLSDPPYENYFYSVGAPTGKSYAGLLIVAIGLPQFEPSRRYESAPSKQPQRHRTETAGSLASRQLRRIGILFSSKWRQWITRYRARQWNDRPAAIGIVYAGERQLLD